MAELTVDLTYGSALYEAAEDVGKRDEIAKNADWVLEVLRDNPDLQNFINYPAISARDFLFHLFHLMDIHQIQY